MPDALEASQGLGDLNAGERIWGIGPLVRAIADALASRFNPVWVEGEMVGFSKAASGHCYLTLKDESGQLRCAMFRRTADSLTFVPRDGLRVRARGRLDVYAARGDLQLIIDTLRLAGQGGLFEQFLRLKQQLTAEGLFEPARKRPLPPHPRSIGVVTSLGAAALRDVITALRRRVPHLPVTVYPASVQGRQAPAELCAALELAYRRHQTLGEAEVLLLVRGGGSLEDLWAFNDEDLVRTLVRAPMPVISGVGHETDFTLADFAVDLRAPTPTAAAELCAPTRDSQLAQGEGWAERLEQAVQRQIDQQSQRLDRLAQRLGQPSARLHQERQGLLALQHRWQRGLMRQGPMREATLQRLTLALRQARDRHLQQQRHRLALAAEALSRLDPHWVLQRGYAWLSRDDGQPLTRATDARPGQRLQAVLADGTLDLRVPSRRRPPAPDGATKAMRKP